MKKSAIVLAFCALMVSACDEESSGNIVTPCNEEDSSCKTHDDSGCLDDAWKCNGTSLYKCISGKWKFSESCDDNTLCNEEIGSCEPNEDSGCTDDTWKCNGKSLYKCISGKWKFSKKCEENTKCEEEIGSCTEIEVSPSDCKKNQHFYADKCEDDDLTHCGTHTNDWTQISGWKSGNNNKKKCFAEECETGYHQASRFDSDNIEWTICEEDTHDACGSINKKCGAEEFCAQGQCKRNCLAGEVICDGSCINPNTSQNFCGADASCTSYIPCSDHEECIDGKCILTSCKNEQDSLCTGSEQNVCVNIHGNDPSHCGACDAVCSDLETARASGCARGLCTYTCNEDRVNCGSDTEPLCLPPAQLNSDPKHCGECDTVCPNNAFCDNGRCIISSCTGNECLYNNACVNLNDHCGTQCINCNTANHASAGICQGGTCRITACEADYHLTDQGKCEANTATACPNGQATGTVNCNTIDQYTNSGSCTNGYCVATQCQTNAHLKNGKCVPDSLDKCGVSETNCSQLAGWISGSCDNGKCAATSCQSGFCLNTLNNECTNAQTSTACGIDGGACQSCTIKQVCSAGSCVEKHCNDNVCQQKTGADQEDICQNDNTHCGSDCQNCNSFTTKAKSGICTTSGTCQLMECQTSYHVYNNACEYNNLYNCGSHGHACNVENADNSCNIQQGQCTFSCKTQYHKYNGGCEPDDLDNCGSHGNQCPAVENGTESCVSRRCNLTCDPGFHEYNNGCERNDLDNCGAHGTKCNVANANNECTAGRCYYTCLPGTHVYNNGCEPDDLYNCGKHGNQCSGVANGSNTCSNGVCTIQCNEGYIESDKECLDESLFISVWSLKPTKCLNFPIQGISGTITIDWGDGTNETIGSDYGDWKSHCYSSEGNYKIKVAGTITKWSCSSSENSCSVGSCRYLDEIHSYGQTTFSNFAFCNSSLYVLPKKSTPRFNNNKMIGVFYKATNFNQSLDNWDTSNITDMSYMFDNATSFNQSLNSWNTSNVTNMNYMFHNAKKFDQPLDNWNTSNVTDMSYMFDSAASFNQSLNSWNTSNVTNMSYMFHNANKFDQSLNNWNTSNVTNMRDMFSSASSFNQPLNNWNTSNVTDMREMFYFASSFNQPLNNWNTSNVTNLYAMFHGAGKFNQSLGNWDTSNVTNMSAMFHGALSFNQSLNSWNTSNVTNLYAMFHGAGKFNQSLDNWDTSNVTNMSYMFYKASSFNQSLNSWNTSNVTNMDAMFYGASSFNQPLNNWNTSNVSNMGGMFYEATSFNQSLNNWDTSNVTSMNNMFVRATSFNQPLNNWDTSNVTNMGGVFYEATSFNQSLNNWDTSNVTSMYHMFGKASSFNQPLNNWDTSNVTSMGGMFYEASSFNQSVNTWNTSKVTDMGDMFCKASSFNQPLNNWDVSKVTNMRSMFESSGLQKDNYCILFTGAYSSVWENFISDLGKSFSCP